MLTEQGYLSERGTSRTARATRCPRCSRTVISGLDADACAFDVDADPRPLTPEQEQAEWTAGRRTYSLSTIGRVQLDRRWAGGRAETRPALCRIVPEHQCPSAR
jgi:hypothetical protein